jgi:hypothetical protein
MVLTLDLPEAANPEALTVAKPDVAKPAIVEPEVPGTTEVASTQTVHQDTPANNLPESVPPELELVNQIWTSWRSELSAGLEQSTAATELEEARKKYEAAQERLATHKAKTAELLSSFLPRLAEIRDPSAAAMVEQIQQAQQTQTENNPPPVAGVTQMDWEEWLKVPTSEILEGIEGLGPKKVTALVERFPTIGHLEDARTEASKAHLHFCKMLTKGIGEQTADRIETAMSDLQLGKTKRKLAVTPVEPQKPEPEIDPSDDDSDQKRFAAQDESVNATEETEESQIAEVEQIARESGIDLSDVEEAKADSQDDEEPWVDPNADDSILYEDVDDSPEATGGESIEDSEDLDEETETSWAEAFHIQSLTDQKYLATNWGALGKNQSQPWKLGNKAYHDKKAVEACPFSDDDDLDSAKDWVLGWTSASMSEMDL